MAEKVKLSKTRAHQTYKTADGKCVPGATTVLNIIAKPALLHWAWQCGINGEDYRKVRDKAADIGTIAHFMCECYVKNQEPDLDEFAPDDVVQAKHAYAKFLDFWWDHKFKCLRSEVQLVSEIHKYGGTLDIVARDADSKIWLVDLKTSKAIYPEYWYQCAAYEELWNANLDKLPASTIDKTAIVRIGKTAEEGDVEIVERADLQKEFRIFLLAKELYTALKDK